MKGVVQLYKVLVWRSSRPNRILPLFGLLSTILAVFACTPQLPESRTGPVEDARYVPIGGIDQWLTIRGRDASNPIVIYIHGGPGAAQSAFAGTYSTYEEDFVLVQWDQRGAGKTFELYGRDTPNLNPSRLIADGVEVASYIRERFPNNPIVLLGHSYGSFIATGIRQRRPDLFSAYVGTGQIPRWDWMTDYQKNYLLQVAREAGDEETVAWLESMGDVTLNDRWFGALSRFMNTSDNRWVEFVQDQLQTSNENMVALRAGQNFSASHLLETLGDINLVKNASESTIPVCMIQGSEDLHTPTPIVEQYFDSIHAPMKEMHILENAGHFAIATHSEKFLSAFKQCPGIGPD